MEARHLAVLDDGMRNAPQERPYCYRAREAHGPPPASHVRPGVRSAKCDTKDDPRGQCRELGRRADRGPHRAPTPTEHQGIACLSDGEPPHGQGEARARRAPAAPVAHNGRQDEREQRGTRGRDERDHSGRDRANSG